jgi:hypothetical protein
MKKLVSTFIIALVLFFGAAHAEDMPSPLTAQEAVERLRSGAAVYSCSMKTDWFSEKPGQCPCCTMDLGKVKDIKDGKAVFENNKQGMDMKIMEKK